MDEAEEIERLAEAAAATKSPGRIRNTCSSTFRTKPAGTAGQEATEPL